MLQVQLHLNPGCLDLESRLLRWGHELSETKNGSSRGLPRIHDIFPCHSSPLGASVKNVSWSWRPGLRWRWNHSWASLYSPEILRRSPAASVWNKVWGWVTNHLIWGGVEGCSVQRTPEALRRSRNFFFSYLVAISFPIEFDVWGRLCTHFEAAKVMTFAPVTQHFTVSPFVKKQN